MVDTMRGTLPYTSVSYEQVSKDIVPDQLSQANVENEYHNKY